MGLGQGALADLVSATGIDDVLGGSADSLGSILQRGYGGRRVLVTGHTGFVGSWLCQLLARAGAEVTGLALDPEPGSLAERLGCSRLERDVRGDVRDGALVADLVARTAPEVVFHLAAQALVLPSFADPLATFTTNVLGTANLLEALRRSDSVRACVVVTSDKCYALGERCHPESDPLGGEDPYSASKACAELVAHAYARSYWASGPVGVATARAGNIIGGGDVALDRVLPDCARAALAGEPVRLRHPEAIRPWQHVLDALGGYLRLGEALLRQPAAHSGPWNFGPDPAGCATVGEIVELFQASWSQRAGQPAPGSRFVPASAALPERSVLTLDSSKARRGLGWPTVLDLAAAVDWSVEIYQGATRSQVTPELLGRLLGAQVERYLALERALHQPSTELAQRSPDASAA